MASEPLHIFDPRRNFQTQGFTGKGATTTIYNATETGVSISGIFQAAEDFAVLGWWNAYDYFSHLRLKHLPRTDLSGLKLEFDIEYDHALDGAMRFDAAKYPSVSWDAMTFVCGKGIAPQDVHEVRLLDHATVLSGSESPGQAGVGVGGASPRWGTDTLHLHFRDTRYTVVVSQVAFDTQLAGDVTASSDPQWLAVLDAAGFVAGDSVIIERLGANEEICTVADVDLDGDALQVTTTHDHPADSYVSCVASAARIYEQLAAIINAAGDSISGRFGPDQTSVITATASESGIVLTFVTTTPPAGNYGKLGNMDVLLMTVSHQQLVGSFPNGYEAGDDVQGISWNGSTAAFAGGDCDKKYHVTLDFTQPFLDKNGVTVPMNDCRKIYMVFAPRFERFEADLRDGCFLTADVGPSDTVWQVDSTSALSGERYFIGSDSAEERVRLISVNSPTEISVHRGYQSSTPGSWTAGTRMKKLSPGSGFACDVEWGCTISNIQITGDGSLKVGGGAARIEEADARCSYAGIWEDYRYNTGWPSQWWSTGHAKRTAPANGGDVRKVTFRYSQTAQHDLYLGTFLNTDCGKVAVSVNGVELPDSPFDLYLSEYGGTHANVKLASGIAAGTHVVEITALHQKHASSEGYYFYFDYLWPLVPQDVPDPPKEYSDVSLAIDFDTDHGYKKPPAWHVWQLTRLGFKGHADVYMGVFWNNKRRRVDATYPYATVAFSGTPEPGEVVYLAIAGTTIAHAIGYGETLQQIVSHFRAAINGMFSGVWADDNYGTGTTLRVQSKAPSWTFSATVTSSPSVTLTFDDHLDVAGTEGTWEMIDGISPVMTEGARRWIRDLASQFQAAGILASFAFSMECYFPPAAMRAKYLSYTGGVVAPGADVDLGVPSHQMHFGARVREYLKQMYKECADEIAAAGAPVVLQFGETQWWYFDNRRSDSDGGMPFYDRDTIDAFAAATGRQIWPFRANTDDPAGDPSHPYETADFLRDRIWGYCQDVIDHVRAYHPTAVFECLWPLDANQGKPAPNANFRALNFHINLPLQWKNSSYGIKYFRCEGFDYDVWQKSATLIRQVITFAMDTLGRPAEECMFLTGLYGPPDPPMAQAYGMWLPLRLYSFCFWAFDQFCLNSRPVPLPIAATQMGTARYFRPRAPRAIEHPMAAPVSVGAGGGAMNRNRLNTRRPN